MADVPGVELLTQLSRQPANREGAGPANQYEDYLDPAVLPYISRDDYLRQQPDISNLTTETGIFENRSMTTSKGE